MARGALRVQCFSENTYIPVNRAKIIITPTGVDGVAIGNNIEIYTDSWGSTEIIDLETPPVENSQTPGLIPYSFANITVERDGYIPVLVRGAQIYPDRIAYQRINFRNEDKLSRQEIIIDVPANVQVGNYPPKIPEAEEKPLPKPQGTVVLPQPVVPEFIRVHAGVPDDNSAPNYTVPYKDYIKNVASCEIYSTWPESTIRANAYAIISFTLNRIYTEWYRGKGKNFDITNSTAYDHAFSYGRNIYENIGVIVDEIFSTYIQRQNAKQPLLTQYCDGVNVQCPNWMTQWGSKYLGDQGRTPYEILTYFYGNNINLVTAPKVTGIPSSYPGAPLTVGSRGQAVRTIQDQLNAISRAFPLIPKVPVDGVYGSGTSDSVKVFQQNFNLPSTGVVDYATWYRISDIYVGVTKIAELRGYEEVSRKIFIPPIISAYENEIPKVPYYM
ncbi:MAG: peptidoglycan-binding protein [Clostridium perfringens]|nr:peptidoglycan-binding protein [Clostridium perfringens]